MQLHFWVDVFALNTFFSEPEHSVTVSSHALETRAQERDAGKKERTLTF